SNRASNQQQTCAACRFQRRKCTVDCPFAPYFPPESISEFVNIHRLFGAGNVAKLLDRCRRPFDKAACMGTIIFQANERMRDRVLGCYRNVLQLNAQVAEARGQLFNLLHQIAMSRQQAVNQVAGGYAYDVAAALQDPHQPIVPEPERARARAVATIRQWLLVNPQQQQWRPVAASVPPPTDAAVATNFREILMLPAPTPATAAAANAGHGIEEVQENKMLPFLWSGGSSMKAGPSRIGEYQDENETPINEKKKEKVEFEEEENPLADAKGKKKLV
ncbi:hypothetical protein AMTR_s00136p00011480, partial [Amborella trichopoda]